MLCVWFLTRLCPRWILSTSLTGDGLARLHAAGRTYALRQKNTSNALMILASADAYAAATATEGDEPDGNHLALDPPLAAIATLHETVELVEEKPKPASADDTATSAAATPQPKPAATALARGKWHEKFGRGR